MDFERIKDDCPWKSAELSASDTQIETCMASGGQCADTNCAPYHWAYELVGTLYIKGHLSIEAYD
jgi:hypothetical protein